MKDIQKRPLYRSSSGSFNEPRGEIEGRYYDKGTFVAYWIKKPLSRDDFPKETVFVPLDKLEEEMDIDGIRYAIDPGVLQVGKKFKHLLNLKKD